MSEAHVSAELAAEVPGGLPRLWWEASGSVMWGRHPEGLGGADG